MRTRFFQEEKNLTDQKVVLQLMDAIEKTPEVSQRTLATKMGIALALTNSYLKFCIQKGWIRAKKIPAKRYAYFITPEGFKEKSKMVAESLRGAFSFFRQAQVQCDHLYALCVEKKWFKIGLIGEGDLVEICMSLSQDHEVEVRKISEVSELKDFDSILVADLENPQAAYERLKGRISEDRILLLDILQVSRVLSEEGKKEKVA